jgi:uncharacterized protein (TIGR02117 family)
MNSILRCSILLSLLLASCASLPPIKAIPTGPAQHKIYVIYRGWHSSILLDAKDFALHAPQLAADLQGQTYVRLGWGDGDYFTGKHKSVVAAAKALVASDYSAVQMLTYDYAPFAEIPTETRVALAIDDHGLQRLVSYLADSIALDAEGRPLRLPVFGGASGLFFQSKQRYSAFSNCNTWSGNALRAAGLPVAKRLTAQGVLAQAKYISRVQAEQGLLIN